eukprot:161696-Prymnesium_polylepis.1
MFRKLALTGIVMRIGERYEQFRVLVALLISITFLSLHLSINPIRRCVPAIVGSCSLFHVELLTVSVWFPCGRPEDSMLITLTEVALILVYTCVLVIKACDMSPDICSTFGLGDAAQDIYLFS